MSPLHACSMNAQFGKRQAHHYTCQAQNIWGAQAKHHSNAARCTHTVQQMHLCCKQAWCYAIAVWLHEGEAHACRWKFSLLGTSANVDVNVRKHRRAHARPAVSAPRKQDSARSLLHPVADRLSLLARMRLIQSNMQFTGGTCG